MTYLQRALVEAHFFFEPVMTAISDADALAAFFRGFGYDLRTVTLDVDAAAAELQGFAATSGLDTLDDVATGARDSELLEDALAVAEQVFVLLQIFENSASLGAVLADLEGLTVEIFDTLVATYLSTRRPVVASSLRALGVIVEQPVATTDPAGRDLDYVAVTLRWDRLGTFIRDTGAWAEDVYGWGVDFEHGKAIDALVALLDSTQLALATKRTLPADEVALFIANGGTGAFHEAALPIVQDTFEDFNGGALRFTNEAGFKVVPYGDAANPSHMGLALALYAQGAVTLSERLTDTLAFDALLDGAATGGAYLAVTPDGLDVVQGAAVDASFEFGFRYSDPLEAPDNPVPLVLAGSADGTRVEIIAAHASVGGNLDGDLFVAVGVEGLAIALDLSGDGFLGEVLAGPIEIKAGDFLVGWRPGRGVYFEGGTSLGVVIPLDEQFGPFGLQEIGLFLDWETALSIAVTLSADLTVGPLYANAEGLGLRATLVPAPDGRGQLGKYDLEFSLVPPTGYAVSLDSDVITGGGLISIKDHEYRGALALRLEAFGLSAFAILNTELPGGRKGFSFIGSIFTEFSIALGAGFFLTGLGGIVGLHRTIDSEALRDVLYEGRADTLLFPADPIENAATILDDMAAIFPVREGQHVFGPVAKIGFGQPILIEGKLGLVLEVGAELRLLILGGVSCALPDPVTALVELNLTFFGEIDFAAGTVSFDATLQNSRILTFALSGDMALRTGWGDTVQHVVSFGGLHPRYPKPSNLPDLRRLSLSFGSNNPRLTLTSYLAVTHNSLQFGARADLYVKGPKIFLVGQLAAEGNIYFDALIYFNPFEFEAELGGGLALLVDGDVVLSLAFELRFTGPNPFFISGKVWATVFGVDVDFGVTHTWGTPRPIPPPQAHALTLLRDALTRSPGFEPVAARTRTSGVTFNSETADAAEDDAVDPVGGLRLVQRVLPLGVKLDKIGEAQLVGPRTVDVALYQGATEVDADAAELEFVRGHFWSLDESERLRAPSFEHHKAGVEVVGGSSLVFDAAGAIDEVYAYEMVELGEDDEPATLPAVHALSLASSVIGRWRLAEQRQLSGKWPQVLPPLAPDAPFVMPTVFVTHDQVEATRDAALGMVELVARGGAAARSLTRVQASLAAGPPGVSNPVVADYVTAGVL